MQTEQISVTISPALYSLFNRLKTSGSFTSDQDLLQAAFNALDRELQRGNFSRIPDFDRYMRRPGLGPDDYDT
ncbi:MAG: hypothetical protein K0Q50_3028 [Vampirovibrio sp.]|jgi:hypothetical protein|nr:hypothetical protein [Vampirovibrio sp.]